MEYLVGPIATIMKWTFDSILVPLGDLPVFANPNTIFIAVIGFGLLFWLKTQGDFNKKAEREGGLK